MCTLYVKKILQKILFKLVNALETQYDPITEIWNTRSGLQGKILATSLVAFQGPSSTTTVEFRDTPQRL